MGSSRHTWTQHVWIQTAHLNPFFTFNGPEPNTLLKIFSGIHASLSVFHIDLIRIILNRIHLKISQEWNYTSKLIGYKYIMNPSNSMFTIFSYLTLLTYMFLKSISLKYYYTFFSTKLLTWVSKNPYIHQKGSFAGTSY